MSGRLPASWPEVLSRLSLKLTAQPIPRQSLTSTTVAESPAPVFGKFNAFDVATIQCTEFRTFNGEWVYLRMPSWFNATRIESLVRCVQMWFASDYTHVFIDITEAQVSNEQMTTLRLAGAELLRESLD